MKILANFTKKVSTGDYENETYMVTIEAESEFNNVDQIADYLFHQAREAVQRQINGGASGTVPSTAIPSSSQSRNSGNGRNGGSSCGNGNGNGYKATEKQVNMLRKLFDENFDSKEEARAWLRNQCSMDSTANISRRDASRVIEKLLDFSRAII